MQNRPKILFIADKWCEGNKLFGISEWEIGVQKSLESLNLAKTEVFHLDDYAIENGKKGDKALLEKIQTDKPDIICLITYKMPGTAINVPDWSTLEEIKNVLKIPIVAIWVDPEVQEQVEISLAILPYTTLSLGTTSSAAIARINRPDKYLYTWVPKDPRIFNDPNKLRDIDVSYVGSPKKHRLKKINYLINHGIKVVYGGGERQEHLTTEQYADRYQRSKISLSFSRAAVGHAMNARPFEVMLCGAMLLEQESFETMKLYIPYVDYVPYTSKRDMLKKAQYYLAHDEERKKIARNGLQKTETLYSAKKFWEMIINEMLNNTTSKTNIFKAIPTESLTHLSSTTAFRMKTLNSLCSTTTGFFIYKICHLGYWEGLFSHFASKFKPFLARLLPKNMFEYILHLKRKLY